MKRKTTSVKTLVDKANGYLRLDTISQEKKETISFFIASILHETGNYRGFSYNFPWEDTAECRAKEYNRCYHYTER
jgi:hypothetical protein